MVAVHDCDIRDYARELLARLCFPTVHPNLNYEFAKGYYGRVTDRLYGRVTRLFMTPLLRAMKSVLGPAPAARLPRLRSATRSPASAR